MADDNEYWIDRDYTDWTARACENQLCEECEADTSAIVEVSGWARDSERGGWRPLCEAHYEAMRADPHHNPPGARADAYVNLGAAL